MEQLMKSDALLALESAGLSYDEEHSSGDLMQGKLDTWNRSSGRPFNYVFVSFSDVTAIRYLANWEVTGTAKMFSPNATYSFSLSLDENTKRLQLVLDFMRWTIPTVGGPIDVINSQPTRELVVKFKQQTFMDSGGWYMSEGSLLYVKDVDGSS